MTSADVPMITSIVAVVITIVGAALGRFNRGEAAAQAAQNQSVLTEAFFKNLKEQTQHESDRAEKKMDGIEERMDNIEKRVEQNVRDISDDKMKVRDELQKLLQPISAQLTDITTKIADMRVAINTLQHTKQSASIPAVRDPRREG